MIPNNILIVSKPRFGSTVFCEQLGNLTNKVSLSEPNMLNKNHIEEINKHTSFVMKIIAAKNFIFWEIK